MYLIKLPVNYWQTSWDLVLNWSQPVLTGLLWGQFKSVGVQQLGWYELVVYGSVQLTGLEDAVPTGCGCTWSRSKNWTELDPKTLLLTLVDQINYSHHIQETNFKSVTWLKNRVGQICWEGLIVLNNIGRGPLGFLGFLCTQIFWLFYLFYLPSYGLLYEKQCKQSDYQWIMTLQGL